MIYMKQEDEAYKNPNTALEEEDAAEEPEESFMYFIRNGKFSVNIKTEHLRPTNIGDENDKNKE